MSIINVDWEHRKEVAKERLKICQTCPMYLPASTQCKECGCIMLVKTMLASSECPLGKWSQDKEETK